MIRYSAYRMPRMQAPIAPAEPAPPARRNHVRSPDSGRKSTWTDADDARLIELRGEGLHFQQIALRMGRSTAGVCHRYNRLKGNIL